MSMAVAERCGSFAVALLAAAWRREGYEMGQEARSVWASVTLEAAGGQPVASVWFGADDENVVTKSVDLGGVDGAAGQRLDYVQSSRPVALSRESFTALLDASLVVSLFCGTTRSRPTDELWGESRVSLMPAMLASTLREELVFARTESRETITLDLRVDCDAELADFALSVRVMRVQPGAITNLPGEWALQCANNEEAMRACAAPDRNAAVYELEISLPEFHDGDSPTSNTVKFAGGKLLFEPCQVSEDDADLDGVNTLSGEWVIRFTSPPACKVYPKLSLPRLIDYLQVEKMLRGTLRRLNIEPAGRVTAVVAVDVSGLAKPGLSQLQVWAPLKQISPLPKESLEQELAASSSNDEKKRVQALLNDYEAGIVQAANTLSVSIRTANTRLQCTVQIMGSGPLVLEPPITPAPTKTVEELITPRDLSEEFDQRKDVVTDLRTEIRRIVLSVLREYDDSDKSLSREEKRQRIVFRLNSQGLYHEFKEKLKKRVVPLIRDQFADELDLGGQQDERDLLPDPGSAQHSQTRVNARKKFYFASVYAFLMEEVQRVLHEAFYASATATLEKADQGLKPRDDAKVTLTLSSLGLRALENEVNGDIDKSDALHLDRIAFAEDRAVEFPQAAASMRPTLGVVWFDYGKFCISQGELDKAGAACRKCLALEPHCVLALIAYGALLCELQDIPSAEGIVKNALGIALEELVKNTRHKEEVCNVMKNAVTAHALMALVFHLSSGDTTGNLVLFELLKAQRILHQLRLLDRSGSDHGGSEPSFSSVWIHLADAVHPLRLRGITQRSLQLADDYHRPRDILSHGDRVLRRVILAEVLSLRGEGERATALLLEALEIDRCHAFAWLVLGMTYLQIESQTKEAIECLQHCFENKERLNNTQRLCLFVRFGLAQLQTAQFPAAKATFLCGCEEFAIASMWLGVGIASMRLEDWDGAQIALAEANRLDPTNPDVWGYLALVALSTQPRVTTQHELRAKQSVSQALRYQLSNPVLLRELSSGFVAIDRLEDAERLLRRSLVFQESSLARKTLADVLAAQNCAEEALKQYKQSMSESHDLAQRLEYLEKCAILLTTLGRPEEAVEYRQMARCMKAPEDDVREPEVVEERESNGPQ